MAWSNGSLKLRKTPVELDALRKDREWAEKHLTRSYVAAHPFTREEIEAEGGTQMNFHQRRLAWEQERKTDGRLKGHGPNPGCLRVS